MKGKSEDEVEKIKEEYRAVVPVITKKEREKFDGWMTSDTE